MKQKWKIQLNKIQLYFTHSKIPLGGFPGDSAVKNPPVNAGDQGSISGSGRASGEGNGNLLQ